ncbi:hypothetical protein ARMGADRAFT_1098214 [Armillaria gallica]|uniref:Uncharacterized protein n=1 Tax=Armillaria gallica TaxID=47427 RepID=A0A2H3CWJ8_ARMGA|nr:hypothetical protein ARMGADRAFT_1098214 [Armillaria gallica]
MTILLTTIPRCAPVNIYPPETESGDQSIRLYRSRVLVSSTIVDSYSLPGTQGQPAIFYRVHPEAFKLINSPIGLSRELIWIPVSSQSSGVWYNKGIQIICWLEGLAPSDAFSERFLSLCPKGSIFQHELLGPSTSQARILDVMINWAESTRQVCSQNLVDDSILRHGILPYGIERRTELYLLTCFAIFVQVMGIVGLITLPWQKEPVAGITAKKLQRPILQLSGTTSSCFVVGSGVFFTAGLAIKLKIY